MLLLVHPDIKDITLEGIFYALGDKQRLQIVKNLASANGEPLSCMSAVKGINNMPVSLGQIISGFYAKQELYVVKKVAVNLAITSGWKRSMNASQIF